MIIRLLLTPLCLPPHPPPSHTLLDPYALSDLQTKNFIYFYLGQVAVLLFKSG